MMNRRTFMKTMAKLAALPVLAPLVPKILVPKPDPVEEYLTVCGKLLTEAINTRTPLEPYLGLADLDNIFIEDSLVQIRVRFSKGESSEA